MNDQEVSQTEGSQTKFGQTESNQTNFGQTEFGTYKVPPAFVQNFMREMERAGVCETGIVSDSRRRGESVNIDPCGWDDEQALAVLQVRQCIFHPRKFNRVRRDYYLCGYNENGTFFAHSIESPMRSSYAKAAPKNCVEFALSKIWGVKISQLDEVVRQGDIAFIPVKNLPADAAPFPEPTMILRESHILRGEIFTAGESVFVKFGASMRHVKKEHAAIRAKKISPFYRVALGNRAETWGFSAPTAD